MAFLGNARTIKRCWECQEILQRVAIRERCHHNHCVYFHEFCHAEQKRNNYCIRDDCYRQLKHTKVVRTTAERKAINTNRIKNMSGGDPIETRNLYANEYNSLFHHTIQG